MFDVNHLIAVGGLLILGLFLFAEVGLFLGFFLPGDTLLLTAGIFAMQGKLPLIGVILVGMVAAIAGDNSAYFIGRKAGPRVFKKENSVILNPRHIVQAEAFYEKHGSKTVLVAHFLPVVRTFTPLLGGVAKMPYKKFFIFDAIGDGAWAISLTLLGYYVASRIHNIDHYILIVVVVVVICSASPTIYRYIKYLRNKRAKKTKDS